MLSQVDVELSHAKVSAGEWPFVRRLTFDQGSVRFSAFAQLHHVLFAVLCAGMEQRLGSGAVVILWQRRFVSL